MIRLFFLLGYTLFAFFIIVSEYLFFYNNNEISHIAIFIVFLVQLIISYPTSFRYDASFVFKSFSQKTCILLAFTNTFGIFVVINNPLINNIGILHHSFFIVSAAIYFYFLRTNRLVLYKKK